MTQTAPEIDLSFVDETVERLGRSREAAIPILQALQEHYRYLPEEAMRRVAERTDLTPAALAGVATFYGQFRLQPAGQHIIKVCVGTACHVAGAETIVQAYKRHLEIPEEEDTDADRLFTVERVACLGCCTLAPVVQIEGVTYGHVTGETVGATVRDFLQLQARGESGRRGKRSDRPPEEMGEIRIGVDSADIARGSAKVFKALQEVVDEIDAPARVKTVGSMGMAYLTPVVEVVMPGEETGTLYAGVQADDARDIVLRHFQPGKLSSRVCHAASRALDRLLTDEAWEPVERFAFNVRDPQVAPFDGPQKRVVTEHSGRLDPTDLGEYRAFEGFRAFEHCLRDWSPERVIDEVAASGLRGRGGGGYPSGRKWHAVRDADGSDKKYIVCNGDEGDPGAFMDRMLLECYPYRVIEGMAIAAYAIGADEGYFYIRSEYPLAIKRVQEAIDACEREGLLGEGILDTRFSVKLRIMVGAGAFVCGEETALLASIEGHRGMPRFRPPYPAEHGLWGKPTLVNNAETFATIPWVFRNGAAAFAGLGTERSKGSKVFALAGKIERGGLIEVPMGITIGQIVEEIGGGIPDGHAFKAVQVGGPSGGCIPASLADTPIDYEALKELGAMMGSGGMVVLDDTDCMVEIARYFLEFTQDESCGKCTFCRVGTRRMLEVLTGLCEGRGKKGDIEELEHLARVISAGSLCGLGKTAPNPVLTTLRYFRDEYEAHIQGRCPAAMCKPLIHFTITDDCIGCTRCAQRCPADAIEPRPYELHEIDDEKCVRCYTCRNVCPVDAVHVE